MYSGFSLQGESENLSIVSKHGNCLILIKSSNGISGAGFVKMHKKEQKCAEITKMKTHIVIHIEKRRKMQEIKLYTILSTLSTDEKTESCGIRNVQNKQLFCEVITAIQFLRQSEKKYNCQKKKTIV